MSRKHTDRTEPKYRGAKQSDWNQTHSRRQFLSGVTAVGISTVVAGCSSQSETNVGQQSESGQTVKLMLDGAPDGLQKFEARILSSSGKTITEINPGVIDGDEFQVVSGGVGNIEAEMRAADLSDTVGTFREQQLIVAVTFESEVQESRIDVSTSKVTNDSGDRISQEQVGLELTS